MSVSGTNNDEQKTHHIFRISEIANEPLEMLPAITGYEDLPLVSLEDAVEPLISLLPAIQSYVQLVKQRCKNPPANNLTVDQSASIMLYSVGWKPLDQCLYVALNTTLRSKDRNKLQPWFPYLKLFLTALSYLPPVEQNIYRGIVTDLSENYRLDEIVVWWGFASCTSLINILQSEQFFNITTKRTLFTIECYSGKDIRQHSYYQLEEEFLLHPGTKFKVEANFNQSNGVHSIRLHEIETPLPTSIAINPPKTESTETTINQQKTILKEDSICAGGNENGDKTNQLYYPSAVCIDDNETMYIADSRNHRIMEWKSKATEGQVVAGGNGVGIQDNQLSCPTGVLLDRKNDTLIICDQDNRRVVQWPLRNGTSGKTIISDIDCWGLAMDKNGDLYVSNTEKNEVRRWKIGETSGTLVAGGNGRGNRLDQLNGPTSIFVDENDSIYIGDRWNHRVMKWKKDANRGIIVAGSECRGNDLNQLSNPLGLVVDERGTVYVADCGNDRIVCWFKEATEGVIGAGENTFEKPSKQFVHPTGLALDRRGNLYVVDQGHHSIQKFTIHQN